MSHGRLYSYLTSNKSDTMLIYTPEFMSIYRFFYCNCIKIIAFAQIGKSSNATRLCICIYRVGENKTCRFKPCFILLLLPVSPKVSLK